MGDRARLGRLDGKLVVVAPGEGEAALGLVAEGAAVLVAGDDSTAVGSLVAGLRAAGARAAGFVGDPVAERAAWLEMASELFPDCEVVEA